MLMLLKMMVRSKRFSSRACCPQKSTVGSAAYYLFATRTIVLEPGSTGSVETDIGFCFSNKYAAKIYSRSSLSLPCVGGGIIGSDFCGNMRVILHNFS